MCFMFPRTNGSGDFFDLRGLTFTQKRVAKCDNMKYKRITYYRLTKQIGCDLMCNIGLFQKMQSDVWG